MTASTEVSRCIVIPQLVGDPMRWDFYVLQAARGSVFVPDYLHLALPCFVGERLGKPPTAVDEEDLDRVETLLPGDPLPLLRALLHLAEVPVPDPTRHEPQLDPLVGLGSFRPAVGFPELLHDAALNLQLDYGAVGFVRCFEGSVGDAWDSRDAVSAMMYLLLLREI